MNPEDKYCPLFLTSIMYEDERNCKCIMEDCAWFDEDKQKCAIAVGGVTE